MLNSHNRSRYYTDFVFGLSTIRAPASYPIRSMFNLCEWNVLIDSTNVLVFSTYFLAINFRLRVEEEFAKEKNKDI